MDYPNNGPGQGAGNGASNPSMDASEAAANVREYAEDAAESFNAMMERGKDMVVRYPILSVAGAVAAGYLFARFVARRR